MATVFFLSVVISSPYVVDNLSMAVLVFNCFACSDFKVAMSEISVV
jgi:hypothetical protein